MTAVATLVDGRAFLEGPRWRRDSLYVSDMHAHEVLRVSGDGDVDVVVELDGPPSGLGWLPDGDLVVVSMEDRRVVRADGRRHADLSELAAHEINDMVVDRRTGRAFVSQFGYDMHGGERVRPSALLTVAPDGTAAEAAPELRVANGLVVAADDRTLIVAESAGKCLTAFTIDDDGSLHDRRTWADLPVFPDGICLDAEGAVWVAGPVSDVFVRVREGGEVTDTIPVEGGGHAIACALGGDGGRTLFMCIAETLGGAEESRARRSARIDAATVGVPGVERP